MQKTDKMYSLSTMETKAVSVVRNMDDSLVRAEWYDHGRDGRRMFANLYQFHNFPHTRDFRIWMQTHENK